MTERGIVPEVTHDDMTPEIGPVFGPFATWIRTQLVALSSEVIAQARKNVQQPGGQKRGTSKNVECVSYTQKCKGNGM